MEKTCVRCGQPLNHGEKYCSSECWYNRNCEQKTCISCGVTKNAKEFNWQVKGKGYRQSMCRECHKKRSIKDYEQYKEKRKESMQKWYQKNKKYKREKRQSDINYRLANAIRAAIWRSLGGNSRSKKWENILGYTLEKLKCHLEAQFKDGMNWSNYGEWQIDHIKPLSSFDILSTEDNDFKKCWELDNLQPLWAEDNRRKWANY